MNTGNTFPEPSRFIFNVSIDCTHSKSNNRTHDRLEIIILQDGNATALIDNSIYEMCSGDIVFIPLHLVHKTTYHTDTHSRISMLVSKEYIPEYAYTLFDAGHYTYRNPRAYSALSAILNGIEEEYSYKDQLSDDMIVNYVHLFFATLCRHQNYYNYERSGTTIFVEKILDYIRKNYASDISLSDTAAKFAITPQYLSGIFKKETGITFNKYLTMVRFSQAEHQLKKHKGKSISEIASSCGFQNSNYFSHKFCQEYGISPLQYSKLFM